MNPASIEKIEKLIISGVYRLGSRVHTLNSFPRTTYVKRDDELSFGISGSKIRKLQSLIDHWQTHHVQKVEAIGGQNSNHILATAQACREQNIPLQLHLLQSHGQDQSTNYQFLNSSLLMKIFNSSVERDGKLFSQNFDPKS